MFSRTLNDVAISTENVAPTKDALKTGHSRQSSSISTCTGSSSNLEAQCWADMKDDFVDDDSTARHLLQEEDPANDIQSITMESLMDGDTSVQANSEGSLTSVGSRQHHLGRCKPCAFFHTKGCKSASGCLFCHLCPPNEKQRRKALYRRMCQKFQPVMAVAAQRWGNQKSNHMDYSAPITPRIGGAALGCWDSSHVELVPSWNQVSSGTHRLSLTDACAAVGPASIPQPYFAVSTPHGPGQVQVPSPVAIDGNGHQFWAPASSIAQGFEWQSIGATSEYFAKEAPECQPALLVTVGVCPPSYALA